MSPKRFVLYFCVLSLCCVIACGNWVVPPSAEALPEVAAGAHFFAEARAACALRAAQMRLYPVSRVRMDGTVANLPRVAQSSRKPDSLLPPD